MKDVRDLRTALGFFFNPPVSKLLNHVETGVTAVYDRYSYDLEKRRALIAWGAEIEGITRVRVVFFRYARRRPVVRR